MREQPAQVAAITSGIRSFTTTPYVFTSLAHADTYTGTPPDKVSYLLVRVAPGADIGAVRQQLAARLSKVEVLTPQEFRTRSRQFWLFTTGAGAALFFGAVLGVIVGTVIVAQTLYSSTKDHLGEFATLRAIGSSSCVHQQGHRQPGADERRGWLLARCIGRAGDRQRSPPTPRCRSS